MNGFTLKSARVIGTPSDTIWSQTYTIDNLYFVLVLEQSSNSTPHEQVNLAAAGKELFLRIEQAYRVQGKKDLGMLRVLCELIVKETADVTINTLVAGMLVEKILYLGAKNGTIFLKREGTLKSILAGEEKFSFASGILENGDLICLLSSSLAREIDEKKGELFSSDDPEEIGEALLLIMHQSGQQGAFIALIANVSQSSAFPRQEPDLDSQLPDSKPQVMLKEPEKPIFNFQNFKSLSFFRSLLGTILQGRSRRVIATVLLFLIVLFGISLVLGVQKRNNEARLVQFTNAYEEALRRFDEGVALSDLNPALSVKTLLEAKKIAESENLRIGEKPPAEKEKLTELVKKIEDGLQTAFRIETILEAAVYFDLTVIKDGASGDTMSFFDDLMLILDKKNSALYTLTIPKKQGMLVRGNIDQPLFEAVGGDIGFVFTGEGIERISFASKKPEKVLEADEQWEDLGALAYFGGNLYLLDKAVGSIYKYQGTESSFGGKRQYLTADIKPDFSKSISMAIDGSIWVLFSDGRISKFTQGVPESFSISGIDIELSNPTVLFTDEETEHLYILDKGNKRVVVVKKDGTYISQYRWNGISDVTDIVVSEKEKKILLLSGSRIYGIDIK